MRWFNWERYLCAHPLCGRWTKIMMAPLVITCVSITMSLEQRLHWLFPLVATTLLFLLHFLGGWIHRHGHTAPGT
jgi:hypothetical protein